MTDCSYRESGMALSVEDSSGSDIVSASHSYVTQAFNSRSTLDLTSLGKLVILMSPYPMFFPPCYSRSQFIFLFFGIHPIVTVMDFECGSCSFRATKVLNYQFMFFVTSLCTREALRAPLAQRNNSSSVLHVFRMVFDGQELLSTAI